MADQKEIEAAVRRHPLVRALKHLATAFVTAVAMHYQPFIKQEPIGEEQAQASTEKRLDALERRMNHFDRRIDQILENQIRASQGKAALPAPQDPAEAVQVDPSGIHASN
jgi:hypothetical protein